MSLSTYVDQAFAFAHGRIGVLQQFLLARTDIDRLLGAHDLQETEHILTELKMTANIDQGLERGDAMLDAVAAWVKREVIDMSPPEKHEIFQILWLENDAPLLAYLLKQQHGFTSEISRVPADSLTTYEAAELRKLMETEKSEILPETLTRFVHDVSHMQDPSPAHIDAAVAQWLANAQLKIAKTSKSAGIRTFVRHRIDVVNIRTALRLISAATEVRKAQLISGGSMNVQQLLGDRKSIAHAVEYADLGLHLTQIVQSPDSDTNALERALSDVLASDIADMWNVTLSVEPLFAFAALAASQLRVLRVILIGKRAALSPQDIKKILPPFIPVSHYVA